jgi:heme-degrading monooxygenase HmoA
LTPATRAPGRALYVLEKLQMQLANLRPGDAFMQSPRDRRRLTGSRTDEEEECTMSTTVRKRPAIARIWRGRTTRDRADEYEKYNYEVGIKPLIEKALGVQTLREDRQDETEFMTISYWESVDAMSNFAGDDPTKIHHLERDEEFLIELPKEVQILRLLTSHGVTGSE